MAEWRKSLEEDDPYEFVAVQFPVAPGASADEAMARCVIEEYALMGARPDRIRRLFEIPTYRATHAIYQRHGAALVERLLTDVFGAGRATEVQ